MMDLTLSQSFVGFAAMLISLGIITVSASTFLTGPNVARVFEYRASSRPDSWRFLDESGEAAAFRDEVADLPRLLARLYFVCHVPPFVLLAVALLYDLFRTLGLFGIAPDASGFPPPVYEVVGTLWITSFFLLLGYLLYVVWRVFRTKRFIFGRLTTTSA